MQTAERSTTGSGHPLDPLTADEILAASDLLRQQRQLSESVRFVFVALKEPPKDVVLGHEPGQPFDREASVVLRDRAERKTYESVVSLSRREVRSWRERTDVQPSLMGEEFAAAEEAVKADPRWQEAMRRRGVKDLASVLIDPWSAGYYRPEEAPTKGRFIRPLTWVRAGGPDDNGYARPVEGLIALVDLDRMQVVEVEDHGVVPLPRRSGDYTPAAITQPSNTPHFPEGPRRDLKPVEISQPQGPSFRVDGREVRWQKWRFRVGFTPREGLVPHLLEYEDRGRKRPVLYRGSLTEMFIPYGDPRPTHYRKNVFDMGEYSVGMLANSLEHGCDCLGEIHYFDAFVNDNDGKPVHLKNAICMHEEDYGVLCKHTDFHTGTTEVRRSRRLVVSMIVTVGNYEYGYFWYLHQDGTIEYEVKLTGVPSTGALPEGEQPKHGALLAPGLYGPHHQHFFCARLDMMVDGTGNSVYECDSQALPPGPENPYGSAWVVKSTLLARESEAQRTVNPLAARYWKIVNPSALNALGEPVAYRLQPGDNVLPFFQPGARPIQRAGFATRHLWVTAYDPDQNFPAGDYPNQHPGGDGLPAYAAADRPLQDRDVVVWYTFGAHHVLRPEDWPVMPVTHVRFQLRPEGFFDGNPALDVPPSQECHHAGSADRGRGFESGSPAP